VSITDDVELRRTVCAIDSEIAWGIAPALIVMGYDIDHEEVSQAPDGPRFVAACLPDLATYIRSSDTARTITAAFAPVPLDRWLAIPFTPLVVVAFFEVPPDAVALPEGVRGADQERRVVVMAGIDGSAAALVRPQGVSGRWLAIDDLPSLADLSQGLARLCARFQRW